jgi:hypothetical protein
MIGARISITVPVINIPASSPSLSPPRRTVQPKVHPVFCSIVTSAYPISADSVYRVYTPSETPLVTAPDVVPSTGLRLDKAQSPLPFALE